jgi:hypothetical protein
VVNKLISGVDQMERAGLTERAQKEAADSGSNDKGNKSDSEDDDGECAFNCGTVFMCLEAIKTIKSSFAFFDQF